MHSVRHFRSGGRVNARKVQKRTMDKKGKQQFLLVAFGVALYAAAALLSTAGLAWSSKRRGQ